MGGWTDASITVTSRVVDLSLPTDDMQMDLVYFLLIYPEHSPVSCPPKHATVHARKNLTEMNRAICDFDKNPNREIANTYRDTSTGLRT